MHTRKPKVLALDSNGTPLRWMSYQESAKCYSLGNILWTPTTDSFRIFGGTNRINEQRTILDVSTIVALKGVSKSSPNDYVGSILLDNNALFFRDKYMCAYCHQTYPSSKLTRDHVIPTSRGGENTWTNCVTSCSPCNRYKDDYLLEELDGFDLAYIPYRPTKSEFLILKNRNILQDQMEYLLKFVPKDSNLHD